MYSVIGQIKPTTLCVLQSCPPIVKSKRKVSELMTSILQVSERPKA